MSGYTKGPWRVVAFGAYLTHNSPTRFWQASVTSAMGRVAVAIGTTEEEAEANARLMAAAPTMADELFRAKAVIRSPESFDIESVCSDIEATLRNAGLR